MRLPYCLGSYLSFCLPICALLFPVAAQQVVELTSADGKQTMEATVTNLDRNGVDLVLEDGRQMSDVALDFFDEPTVERLRSVAADLPLPQASSRANLAVSATELNALFGISLFRQGSLWDEFPSAVAQRLGWPQQSLTSFSQSYRAYFLKDEQVLGARCYTGAIYASNGQIDRISLVFANKGDAFQSAGSGQDHFEKSEAKKEQVEQFLRRIDQQAELIDTELTELLGKAQEQNFGNGNGRGNVRRWDWIDQSILLVRHREEMLQILVVSAEVADATGKVGRTPAKVLEARLGQCVKQRDNGDVIIAEMPMVDQGPKGYCVPATMERLMRYMGIQADMYDIAVLSEAGYGGGTTIPGLIEGIKRDVRWASRNLEESRSGELSFEQIQKLIDRGIALVWGIHSTPEYNALTDQFTRLRADTHAGGAAWEQYQQSLDTLRNKGPILPPGREYRHVVLIIGYNSHTNEIATSDSWGPAFKERWIPLEEAKQVSSGSLFWIAP